MNSQLRRLVVTCLTGLSFLGTGRGQVPSPKTPQPEVKPALSGKASTTVTLEEKVIRATYEKLTMLNKAALLSKGIAADESPDENLILRFELSNFRIGPIQEIWGSLHSQIKTGGSGEIIRLTRATTRLNKGPEHVSYMAQWGEGQYASIYDPQWTVGDLLSLESDEYYNVGAYALYDVAVYFQGKTRSYRALTLFHNPYGSTETLKPEFWDSVVGMGGTLTEVWNEKRPSAKPVDVLPRKEGTTSATPGYVSPPEMPDHDADGKVALSTRSSVTSSSTGAMESYSTTSSVSNPVRKTVEDTTEHSSGKHGETVDFRGSCLEQPNNGQFCNVDIVGTTDFDNGRVSNLLYSHSYGTNVAFETATGPRGTAISCLAARGIGVKNCLSGGCHVSVSVQLINGSATTSGGDVWNGSVSHRHTCAIPAPVGGGGGCTNTWMERKCLALGEGWDEDHCRCRGDSPVLIDVAGDGLRLTDALGGVPFDLDADGHPDRLSWTVPSSDDAWLALDRDGDGRIESGLELFGNYTAQPASSEPNGFLALAEFDRPRSGGNSDGRIDRHDAVFSSLRLWQDTNHDGVSGPDELHGLRELGLKSLDLDYRESRRVDEHGNRFKYRAQVRDVRDAQLGRWAWDVFLKRAP